MKKLKNKILQKIGNVILHNLEVCPQNEVKLWFQRGLMFNEFCIVNFNTYLD